MMIRFMIMLIACLFVLAGCGGDSATVTDLPAGAGTFAAGGNFSVGDSPRSVAIGDLNGDGILDLAVANAGSIVDGAVGVGTDNLSVLIGNDDGSGKGDGTFAAAVDYEAGNRPISVVIEDLDADGFPDLIVANSGPVVDGSDVVGTDNVSVLMGNVNGTFTAAINYDVGTNPFAMALEYLNADLILDLVVVNSGSANVSVLMGNSNGTFVPAVNYGVGVAPRSVAIGDLNADGNLDLAVANSGTLVDGTVVLDTDNVSVLKGIGGGAFDPVAPEDIYEAGTAPYSVAIEDLDADGIPDLAVANFSSLNISVLKGNDDGTGNGNGTFATAVDYGVAASPRSLLIENLTADTIPDLVVVNPYSNSISVLIGNADGSYAAVAYAAGVNPLSVAMGDLNGDGTLDLAVANQSSGNVSVLVGNSD